MKKGTIKTIYLWKIGIILKEALKNNKVILISLIKHEMFSIMMTEWCKYNMFKNMCDTHHPLLSFVKVI